VHDEFAFNSLKEAIPIIKSKVHKID